jgi:acetolactate synthase regulatory subunit
MESKEPLLPNAGITNIQQSNDTDNDIVFSVDSNRSESSTVLFPKQLEKVYDSLPSIGNYKKQCAKANM